MAKWSKRRVLLGLIFAVVVAAATVSLLETQERLLSKHMGRARKPKVKQTADNIIKDLKNVKQNSNSDSDESEKRSDRKKAEVEIDNYKVGKDVADFRYWKDSRESKVADFGKKYINLEGKFAKDEDDMKNFQQGNRKNPPDRKGDDYDSKTFQSDLRSADAGKESSLYNRINQAAIKAKEKKTDLTSNDIEDNEDVTALIDQHKALDNYTFLLDTGHVRNCITGKIIGAIGEDFTVDQFDINLRPVRRRSADDKKSFRDIYNGRKWGTNWEGTKNDNSSASGRGANIYWTQEITGALHIIINQLKLILKKETISILDVPCGDMQWMARFLQTRDDIIYTGVDIVPELIAKHKKTFRDVKYKFQAADILEVGFSETYDLIFNRMMLQHLYQADVAKFLMLASQGGSHYLMTTTFPHFEVNQELEINDENPGRFRQINLEVPPYSLPPPLCIQHDGPANDFVRIQHFMALWPLPLQRVALCRNPWAMYLKGSKDLLYSCVQWGHRQP